jgi:hypothetical protein
MTSRSSGFQSMAGCGSSASSRKISCWTARPPRLRTQGFARIGGTYSRSDLIEMGFDKDLVEDCRSIASPPCAGEDFQNESATFFNNVGDNSMALVELFECYVKVDVDGDGVAETVRAFYAGAGRHWRAA